MGGTLKICATIALALWVGGLSLFMGAITPVVFQHFSKEEAGRIVGVLFPAVDRWCLVWGLVTAGALFFLFLNRHFSPASLVLELPVALMLVLTLYTSFVLHPQIRDLKHKIGLPQYQATVHLKSMEFAFQRLYRRSVQIHGLILFLGFLSLGLTPRFLR